MTIQHKNITGADLHEPKGVATATAGKVYISDGSGSGTWDYPPGKAHAEIYITGGTTAHTLAGSSAYSLLNPSGEWTASGYEDIITVDPANGEINLDVAGHYFVSFWVNFTTAAIASGATYNFKYAIDGTVGTRKFTVAKPTNGADKLIASATGILTATAGQTLSIQVAGDGTSSATSMTVVEAGLQAIFLD